MVFLSLLRCERAHARAYVCVCLLGPSPGWLLASPETLINLYVKHRRWGNWMVKRPFLYPRHLAGGSADDCSRVYDAYACSLIIIYFSELDFGAHKNAKRLGTARRSMTHTGIENYVRLHMLKPSLRCGHLWVPTVRRRRSFFMKETHFGSRRKISCWGMRASNPHTYTTYVYVSVGLLGRWWGIPMELCTCASQTIVLSIQEFHLDNVLKVLSCIYPSDLRPSERGRAEETTSDLCAPLVNFK